MDGEGMQPSCTLKFKSSKKYGLTFGKKKLRKVVIENRAKC